MVTIFDDLEENKGENIAFPHNVFSSMKLKLNVLVMYLICRLQIL